MRGRQSGTYVAPSKISLRDFIESEWLPSVKRSVRPSTFESYAGNLRNHVVPTIGPTRLQHVTPAMLNKLYSELERKALKPRTIRYVHTILRHALADAVKWDRLARNPADAADPSEG